MDLAFLEKLTAAFWRLGGQEVNLTGGDASLHPHVSDLVAAARKAGDYHLSLSTNGLRLDRAMPAIRSGHLDEIKLSLHAASKEAGLPLLGPAWNPALVKANIDEALSHGVKITINFTATEQNIGELPDIMTMVRAWRSDLRIIDLIDTKFGDPREVLGRVTADVVEALITRHASFHSSITDRTGCVMRKFRTPEGASWHIKDVSYGLLHTSMCTGCSMRKSCGEGVFVLRVDAEGRMRPCLLREDLTSIIDTYSQADSIEQMLLNGMGQMFPAAVSEYAI